MLNRIGESIKKIKNIYSVCIMKVTKVSMKVRVFFQS